MLFPVKNSQTVLVWENDNPTSTFNAQNISLNTLGLDNYDGYLFVFSNAYNGHRCIAEFALKGMNVYANYLTTSSNNVAYRERAITYVDDSTYSVSTTTTYVNGSASSTTNGNRYLIPIAVYAVRFLPF